MKQEQTGASRVRWWMEKTILNQGCPAFAISHDPRVGYFLTFKKISPIKY
jgi:hypothetical protein